MLSHLLAVGAGCSGAGEDRPAAGRTVPAEPLPETKQATIGIEGFEETFTLWLFRSQQHELPVPFHTYVPEDLVAESGKAAGEAVRFMANFEGERTDDAFLEVRFLPEGTDEEEGREALLAAVRDGETARREDADPVFPGSIAEGDFARNRPDGSWLQGTVALARRGPRFYLLTLQMPETYSEGFVPRALKILEEWRWEDGEPPSRGPIPPRRE